MSVRMFSVLKTLMGRERMVETEPVKELKDILDEGNITTVEDGGGNITVNQSYEMDCLMHRARVQQQEEQTRNGEVVQKHANAVTNGGADHQTTVNLNGKFVTDV